MGEQGPPLPASTPPSPGPPPPALAQPWPGLQTLWLSLPIPVAKGRALGDSQDLGLPARCHQLVAGTVSSQYHPQPPRPTWAIPKVSDLSREQPPSLLVTVIVWWGQHDPAKNSD